MSGQRKEAWPACTAGPIAPCLLTLDPAPPMGRFQRAKGTLSPSYSSRRTYAQSQRRQAASSRHGGFQLFAHTEFNADSPSTPAPPGVFFNNLSTTRFPPPEADSRSLKRRCYRHPGPGPYPAAWDPPGSCPRAGDDQDLECLCEKAVCGRDADLCRPTVQAGPAS